MAALAELMLFDATNPRSVVYQLERLQTDLGDLPGSSGSSRPQRMVSEISTLLRRSNPAELEAVAAEQPVTRPSNPASPDRGPPASASASGAPTRAR